MGHDIYAYKQEDVNSGESIEEKEIAYLRRNASDPLANIIYRVLNCEDMNGGWSGCGGDRTFTHRELQLALKKLLEKGDDPRIEPESTFLHDCLKAADGDVWIEFL